MRSVAAVIAMVLLAACQGEPGSRSDLAVISELPQFITGLPGDGPEFSTTGLQPSQSTAPAAATNNTSADVPARHAAQICTLGFEMLEQGTAPGEPMDFVVQRVRCTAYRPSL
jgi:hypothetical protein